MTRRERVIEFHKTMGLSEQGLGEGPPHIPSDDIVRHRLKLIFEEAFELLGACVSDATQRDVREVQAYVERTIRISRIEVNLPEVADAFEDIDYVVEGARLAFGIDGEPLAAEVHRSNMSKLKDGHRREDGKWIKGPNYSPADIANELRKQGWSE